MNRSQENRRPSLRLRVPAALLLGGLLWSACDATGPFRTQSVRSNRLETHEIPSRGYDVAHYFIDLRLDPVRETIEGVCRIRFSATAPELEEVVLDLRGLEVRGVSGPDGTELAFEHDGDTLAVQLADSLFEGDVAEIAVAYGGRPSEGLWFSGRRGPEGIPTQVFTQGECDHSRGWFPCFDHPSDRATSEVRVEMPAGWVSMAPGERIGRTEQGSTVIEHWRIDHAHPAYLASLVAGELVVVEDEWDGIPLYFVAEARYRDFLEASFHETDEILAFLSEYTGVRYPYPKYSQSVVDNFMWGGMENISATTLTPLTLDDERGQRDEQSHGLVAHEAAHQWFGDLVTCNDWEHLWLNEGLATYMTWLYFEETRGVDEFRARLRDGQERYLMEDRGAKRRPVVSGRYREPEDLLGPIVYEGAAARIHLLRNVLGEDVFRAGLRAFVAENAGRNVVTEDFVRSMEAVSGVELDGFFEQWFYEPGYPEFGVDWSWNEKTKLVTLDVRQLQSSADGTPAVFRTPVDVEIQDLAGTSLHRLDLRERRQSFELPAAGKPFYVRFDKYGWIPKVVHWKRSSVEWIAIATSDDDVNGRRDALGALGTLAAQAWESNRTAHETYVAEIVGRLRADSSPWVRAAAARALGVAGGWEARERLIDAASGDADARVRVAALEALRGWGESPELAEFARRTFEEGFSWQTMGAAAGLVCSAAPEEAYIWITEKLFVDSPHDQLCGMLLDHLGDLKNPSVNDQLLRWARDTSLEGTARGVAVRELGRQRRSVVQNARAIASFLDEENFRLRQAAVEALVELGSSTAREELESYYPAAATPRERRAIEAVLTGPRP